MTRKIFSKKFSSFLVASLLTATIPATTQARWGKGMLFLTASAVCGTATKELARATYSLGKKMLAATHHSTTQRLEIYAGLGIMAMVIGGLGASALLCLDQAVKNLSSKNREKSYEKKNPDSSSKKK